jgi:hypothetical protein
MRAIELRRHRAEQDYERYEAHRRFEEATDIAERIGYPIDHTVTYRMRNGMAYGSMDTKDRPFREQTEQARKEGVEKFTGVNAFEAIRRDHEHAEALLVDQFGRGELAGNVLVKVSMIPDAVREGTAQIDGYRRDLLRSFIRIYYRDNEDVKCRLFSLDQTDRVAMAAVGGLLGINIEPERGSEAVLADHAIMDMSAVDDVSINTLVAHTIDTYDTALYAQAGENYHAGSKIIDKQDALSIVLNQNSLLDEHMRAISQIMAKARGGEAAGGALEHQRRRLAAALDEIRHGGTVGSLADGSVTAREAQGNYGGECATAANTMAMAQGQEWKDGVCRVCLKGARVGECSVCLSCENADNAGRDLNKIHARAKKTREDTIKPLNVDTKKPRTEQLSKAELIKRKFGAYAEVKMITQIGGAAMTVVDRRSGEQIA